MKNRAPVMKVPQGIEYLPVGSKMSAQQEELLSEYAFHYGETYASYLATESGLETLWCRDRRGAVRFVRWARRYLLVVGGLLAHSDDQEILLVDFLRFVKTNHLNVSFFNIGRDQLKLFRRHNFQVTKFGEEPVIRLDKTTWQGKDYEWVRRQENYCRRQGLTFREIEPNPNDPIYRNQIAPELEEVSEEHIASTLHGRELQYFVGRFHATDFGHKRLFVVTSTSRIEAFIVCNPCLSGTMWAVEMYRRRSDATRGVIPFTVLQIMRKLQKEGVAYCSLSLIPFLRCENAVKGDSWIARGGFVLWWKYLNWIFDVRGIYHFKSRFRPEYRKMYVVAWPKVTLPSILAVGFTWGVLRFSPWKLVCHLSRKSNKLFRRRSLSAPDDRPSRIFRRLARRSQPPLGTEKRLSDGSDESGESKLHRSERVDQE